VAYVSRRCYVVNVSQPRFDVEHKTSNSPTYAPSRYIDIFVPIITFRKPLLGGAVIVTFARYPHLFSATHSPLDIYHESTLKVDSFLQGRLINHEVAFRSLCTAMRENRNASHFYLVPVVNRHQQPPSRAHTQVARRMEP
jgi:hypothetical protein